MAKVPDYLKGFNGIVRLIENTCDDPWTVYVESAFPALGQAFLTIIAFGMDDVMRGYFRPTKSLRSLRHGRRGRKGGKKGPKGIPEVGETIGKKLPGADHFRNRPVVQGVKMLWVVDNVVQRGLWYWLIFDVINNFFYDWATAIMESHEDDDCKPSRLLAYGPSDASHALFGWNSPWAPDIIYNEGLGWDVIFTDLPPGGNYFVSFGCTVTLGPGMGSNCEAGLFNSGTYAQPIELGGEVFIDGGSTGQVLVGADIEGGTRVVIAFRNDFGFAALSDIWVFIQSSV